MYITITAGQSLVTGRDQRFEASWHKKQARMLSTPGSAQPPRTYCRPDLQ